MKLNNKAVVDKVFVMVFSIIIVGFAGFLVMKFVISFSDDTDLRLQNEFYEKLEHDYNLVYKTYGAEKVLKYKVHSDVKYVCFVSNKQCINDLEYIEDEITNFDLETLSTLVEANDNIVMYDDTDVMNSYNIGEYSSNDGCFCVKPIRGSFDLILENSRNQVYINQI